MKWLVIAVLMVSILVPGVCAASEPVVELGTYLGGEVLFDGGESVLTFGLPQGGPFGAPILYLSYFPTSRVLLQPEAFGWIASGDGPTETNFRFAQKFGYLPAPTEAGSPYLMVKTSESMGSRQSFNFALGGGVGYRLRTAGPLSLRFEVSYSRWLTHGGANEVSFGIGFGGVVASR